MQSAPLPSKTQVSRKSARPMQGCMTSVYKSSPPTRTAGTPLKDDFRGHLLAYSGISNTGIHFRVHFLFIAVQSRKPYLSQFQQANFG
ncbi:hypothetical protein T03_5182 [Trichinella britovi]|uniref:Uncharacterized protein n=1 Tax=Trichinella britovi TaxID=45882 RepID=A0A0V1CTE6_TRIBR|nr:hypothetical protein T03_5182 [Trichinella britovi]